MIALAAIAKRKPKEIFDDKESILKAIETGSVITIDNGIKALAKVASMNTEYNQKIFPFLITHLKQCRLKDVPQRAESISAALNGSNQKDFFDVLSLREYDLSVSQMIRIRKTFKKLKP